MPDQGNFSSWSASGTSGRIFSIELRAIQCGPRPAIQPPGTRPHVIERETYAGRYRPHARRGDHGGRDRRPRRPGPHPVLRLPRLSLRAGPADGGGGRRSARALRGSRRAAARRARGLSRRLRRDPGSSRRTHDPALCPLRHPARTPGAGVGHGSVRAGDSRRADVRPRGLRRQVGCDDHRHRAAPLRRRAAGGDQGADGRRGGDGEQSGDAHRRQPQPGALRRLRHQRRRQHEGGRAGADRRAARHRRLRRHRAHAQGDGPLRRLRRRRAGRPDGADPHPGQPPRRAWRRGHPRSHPVRMGGRWHPGGRLPGGGRRAAGGRADGHRDARLAPLGRNRR